MKLFKNVLVIMCLLLVSFSLSACGGLAIDGEGGKSEDSVEKTSNVIGFSVSTLNNPFFVSLTEAAEEMANKEGFEFVSIDAREDVAKQASDIEDLVSRGASVIIVNPVDSDAVSPAVETAIASGVKVISIDRNVNGVEVSSSISSDNVLGAKLATEYLVETLGEGAKIAELMGVAGASATIDRGEGFNIVAKEKLDVVSSQNADFNRAKALSVMENILQANPDIKGVFAHNDEMALGAIEAIGDKDIKVVGFDATDDALASIKEGKLFATVAQQPEEMGKISVETAIKLINGEDVEKNIPVEVLLIKE